MTSYEMRISYWSSDVCSSDLESVSSNLKFGAGIWHFATYVDRYATDGYGPPRSLIEMIDLAGQVEDLSVVDINYPFVAPDLSLGAVEAAPVRNNPPVLAITPETYTRHVAKGASTHTEPGIRTPANRMANKPP